jgi:hypothetical protein
MDSAGWQINTFKANAKPLQFTWKTACKPGRVSEKSLRTAQDAGYPD